MKLIERLKITNKNELYSAKAVLSYHLTSYTTTDPTFLHYALLELGTNLYKHAPGGEVWLFAHKKRLILAACDNGPGILDLNWALSYATSSKKDSLGVGLHSLTKHPSYTFEIVTFTQKKLHGTVGVIYEKEPLDPLLHLSIPLYHDISGDFLFQKGRHILFGDIAGHGKLTLPTKEAIQELFFSRPISCLMADQFFNALHQKLSDQNLRSCVALLLERTKSVYNYCGIGNLFLYQLAPLQHLRLQEGTIGSEIPKTIKQHTVAKTSPLLLATDGLDSTKAKEVLVNFESKSAILLLIALAWFAKTHDDLLILYIKE